MLKIIYNNTMELDSSICKHGIETYSCHYCSGQADINYLKEQKENGEKEILNKELQSAINAYDKIKDIVKDENELWIRDEIETLWNECGGRRKIELKISIYLLTLTFNRSFSAVSWQYRNVFIANPYHRSQLVIDFLAEKGIKHPERDDRKVKND